MHLVGQRNLRLELSEKQIDRVQGTWRLSNRIEALLPLPAPLSTLVISFFACREHNVELACEWITFKLNNNLWDMHCLDGARFILTQPEEVQVWNLQTLLVNIFRPATKVLGVVPPGVPDTVVLQLETGQVQLKGEGWLPVNTELLRDNLSTIDYQLRDMQGQPEERLWLRRSSTSICGVTADGEETAHLPCLDNCDNFSWNQCDVGLVVHLEGTFYVYREGAWTQLLHVYNIFRRVRDWWFDKGILCCTGRKITRFWNFRQKVEGENIDFCIPSMTVRCEVRQDNLVCHSDDGEEWELNLTPAAATQNVLRTRRTWLKLARGDRVSAVIDGSTLSVCMTKKGMCNVFDTSLRRHKKRPCSLGSWDMLLLLADDSCVIRQGKELKIHVDKT